MPRRTKSTAFLIATAVAVVLGGCSERKVTESFGAQREWNADERPWYVGQETGPGHFDLVPGADRALIFQLGDGIQGYGGDIAGQGASSGDFIDFVNGGNVIDAIKRCSSEDIHIARGYHGFAVVVRSSDRDREAVECVRRVARRSFSAGYGPAHHASLIERPFQDLQNKAP